MMMIVIQSTILVIMIIKVMTMEISTEMEMWEIKMEILMETQIKVTIMVMPTEIKTGVMIMVAVMET